MRFLGIPFLLVLLLAACGKDIQTPVEPVKAADHFARMPAAALKKGVKDGVSFCTADPDGQYPEGTVKIDTQGNADGHAFGQGGGCVRRSLLTTWAAARAREAFHWDRSNLDDVQTVSDPNVAFKFLSKHSAGPLFFVQHWAMQWDHIVVEGTAAAPKRILIQYQKISGTGHIRYWQGAVSLEQVTPEVTSVAMRNEIDADQTGVNEAAQSVRDFIAKLRTL